MKILKLNIGSHIINDEYLSDEFVIGIKRDENFNIIIDEDSYRRLDDKKERVFTDEELLEKGFAKVKLDNKYSDCTSDDFNDDLTFSVEKYNARKQKESNQRELAELQPELDKLTEDLIQAQAGAIIPDLEERKARFQVIHNRIREIKGKPPREYIS